MISAVGQELGGSVHLASKTDVGQVRSANEDSCDTLALEDGTRLLVVADGMGGHRGGATASRTTVSTILETFERGDDRPPGEVLESAIQAANTRVYEIATRDADLEGMGTTVVAFLMDAHSRGTVAHVGDSRAYRYRRGQLHPITTDHSVVAEMQRRGLISAEEAALHPRRNEILRSVGISPDVEIEIAGVEIAPGDRFVLCSDGLTGVVTDDEIAAVIQFEGPEEAVETLVRMANERGGPDNITVQVLSIPADESEGDPEATAPVELSAVGIQAIESKRRERKRTHRVLITLALISAVAIGYFAIRFLNPGALSMRSNTSRPPATESGPAATTPDRPSRETPPDRFEVETQSPRRGIPREGAQR